jgi:sugar/nucleoside kinase (ribokinase family)
VIEPEREGTDELASPRIVVVGAAARDIAADDPRGWRLGGGVSYGALTTALLGVPTGALVGVDAEAAHATELDLLRAAGVDVRLVPLEHGPVFENIEMPDGRIQRSFGPSDPVPTSALPEEWRSAPGWMIAPVAAEVPDGWADALPPEALVAVGWQGLLRELRPGERVVHHPPGHSAVVRRADLVGVSRDDFDADLPLTALTSVMRPGALLCVTRGARGGLAMTATEQGPEDMRNWPPIPPARIVDATGAGDVFLAALLAARVEPRLVGGRIAQGFDLLLGAAAGSLVLEGHGLLGVAGRAATAARMAEAPRHPHPEPEARR